MFHTRAVDSAETPGTGVRGLPAPSANVELEELSASRLFFPAENVEFIGPTPKTFEHRSDESGRLLRLEFCEGCGTTIGMTAEGRPGQHVLMRGTFDDRNSLRSPRPIGIMA